MSVFESEEYLQRVSTYLNHKLEECTNSEGYRKQSAETRSILLALNIADDYFKAKKQGGTLESDIEDSGSDEGGEQRASDEDRQTGNRDEEQSEKIGCHGTAFLNGG